jgi:HEAT repeat protein
VSAALRDYNPNRDLVTGPVDATMVPSLVKSLQDANREARVAAARGLGLLGPGARAAVPALAEAVRNDASGTVRMAAAEALAAIGPEAKSALPALEAGLKDPRMAQRKDVLAKLAEVHDKLK